MAEKIERTAQAETKPVKTEKSKADKKNQGNALSRFGRRIAKWFREMKSELKKVVWPTGKQTFKNVVVACVVMIVSGIVLWAFDQLAMVIVNALISIGK
jgi:preprotein translocase subunit SecE